MCTICHVRLRPQVFNEVRQNNAIIQCDSCQRILYFVDTPRARLGRSTRLMAIVAYIDGGARGNPGPAGYGVRIENDNGALIEEFHGFSAAPPTTSPSTTGCWPRSAYAQDNGHGTVRIKSDSELLVKQMKGEYRVKNPGLQPLYQQARASSPRSSASRSNTSGASRTRTPIVSRTWRWTRHSADSARL